MKLKNKKYVDMDFIYTMIIKKHYTRMHDTQFSLHIGTSKRGNLFQLPNVNPNVMATTHLHTLYFFHMLVSLHYKIL